MASTFSDLKFELIATGEQSGSWGSTTNTNIGTAVQQAIVGMATLTSADFSSNVATLTLTNTNAAQNARALCLNITATLTAAGTIEVPAIQKPYIIINSSVGGFAVTVKVNGQTGVSVPNGKRTVLYNNATDVGNQIDYLASLSLGSLTGSIVGTSDTQTLTNKTIAYSSNTLTDVVGTTATQTLTNKTLTNPTINNYTEGVVAIGTVTTTNTLSLTLYGDFPFILHLPRPLPVLGPLPNGPVPSLFGMFIYYLLVISLIFFLKELIPYYNSLGTHKYVARLFL